MKFTIFCDLSIRCVNYISVCILESQEEVRAATKNITD